MTKIPKSDHENKRSLQYSIKCSFNFVKVLLDLKGDRYINDQFYPTDLFCPNPPHNISLAFQSHQQVSHFTLILFCCFLFVLIDKQVVHVDKRKSTPAMMFSNDLFEIRNGNWTFETAVASQAVNRSYHVQDKEKPKGWYFEVSLQSSGIMQIGEWRTRDNYAKNGGPGEV